MMNSVTEKINKVVIIDDDLNIRTILRRIVQEILPNVETYTASNGVEGLGLVYTVNPDLIILDATLPKYSGVEVIEFLVSNEKLQERHTPVVLLLDEKARLNLPSNYVQIFKGSRKFIEEFTKR